MRNVTESQPVTLDELRQMLGTRFSDLVKGVVDLRRSVLYPGLPETEWLEFDSMINLRPSFGNRSRGVDDPVTREAIVALIRRLVRR